MGDALVLRHRELAVEHHSGQPSGGERVERRSELIGRGTPEMGAAVEALNVELRRASVDATLLPIVLYIIYE